jgi:hypothetical protein
MHIKNILNNLSRKDKENVAKYPCHAFEGRVPRYCAAPYARRLRGSAIPSKAWQGYFANVFSFSF